MWKMWELLNLPFYVLIQLEEVNWLEDEDEKDVLFPSFGKFNLRGEHVYKVDDEARGEKAMATGFRGANHMMQMNGR